MKKRNSTFNRVFTVLVFLFLYAPILLLIVFSFNEGSSNSVWTGFSLHWYKELFHDRLIMRSVYTTLLVSLIATFVRLAQSEQPYNLICLASAEEEVTGIGGVRMVLEELPMIDFAIVGEPTQMHPAVAERGLMVFDCVARGVSGHAARQEGVNAIYKAMEDIEWFRSYTFPRISPMLGPVKMSVTGIEAGTQHNVIPAECRFVVDVRVNECYQNEELLALVREQVHSEVTPRSTHLSSSFISLDHPAVKRLKALGRVPFASPTMSNQAVMPFTTLKLGPGDSARSHTADEYIQLSEIEQAMEIYYDLLNGLKIKS